MHTQAIRTGIGSFARRTLIAACLCLSASAPVTHAQGAASVASLLQRVRSGHAADVLGDIDALLGKDPGNPGLLFVRGVAEPDASKAITYFQKVVRIAPKSEWADDALYRQYQYSVALGAAANAERAVARLRTEYPKSPWLARLGADEEAPPAAARKQVDECAEYTLQAGIYVTRAKASVFRDEMRTAGYSAEIREMHAGEKKQYEVVVGRFPSKDAARVFLRKLKARHGVDAVVVCK